MKTIIAGGRDYILTREDYDRLLNLPISEVVSGGASGADLGGEQFAIFMGIPIKMFPAEWDKHGRAAGPIRNEKMAEYAEAAVLFPGGNDTNDMFKRAKKHGLKIHDFR